MVESNKPVVLITGVSGYVGSQVCNYFLKDGGFTVRGTVRDKDNKDKIAPLEAAFGDDFKNLELRNADLLDAESLDKAIEGATYVIHTASPFHFKTEKLEELIAPAVDGTLNALKAAAKHKCKRVVVTSSRAAISFGRDPVPIWNDTHWSDIENLTEAGLSVGGGYMLSKTLAEKAAWDY
jgi:nucleoside-diphosphate-sugar epimerase